MSNDPKDAVVELSKLIKRSTQERKIVKMHIHLPCSFGDKVYYISGVDKIKEATIRGFRIYQYCILYDLYNKEEDDYFVMESDEVYFTKEAAKESIRGGR